MTSRVAAGARSGYGLRDLRAAGGQVSPDHRAVLTTTISSGHATECRPALSRGLEGCQLQLAHVGIEGEFSYSQISEGHLVHATLAGSVERAAGRLREGWITVADRRGALSFTPRHQERQGIIRDGTVRGLAVCFENRFVEDACEQEIRADWKAVFNAEDAKAFAIADSVANVWSRRPGDRLTLEVLLLALARHVGRAYGKSGRRRDDGWLHPAALARTIERLRLDPARPPSLHELARDAGLGVSAFMRAFRGSTGKTPAAFARQLRLNYAADILASSDHSTGEVATMSGFASASHLVRSFRAQRGITPARWKREFGRRRMSQNPRKES